MAQPLCLILKESSRGREGRKEGREEERKEESKAICHRKQRKRAGSYFSRMAVIGCAILPRRGKGSSFLLLLLFPSALSHSWDKKWSCLRTGIVKGCLKTRTESCSELDLI